jgi:hypothetical protein
MGPLAYNSGFNLNGFNQNGFNGFNQPPQMYQQFPQQYQPQNQPQLPPFFGPPFTFDTFFMNQQQPYNNNRNNFNQK